MSGMKYEKDGSVYYVPSIDMTEVYKDIKAEFDAKYFTAKFTGDGGTSVTLSGCEFDPDFITIRCFRGLDEYVQIGEEKVLQFWAYDKKGEDNIPGIALVSPLRYAQKVPDNAAILKSEENASCASWDATTKTLTISNLATSLVKSIFGNGLTYHVVAVKTEE